VDTLLLNGRSAEEKERLDAMYPMQRMAQPDEITSMIKFVLSSEASFVTGQA
jgi:NAD(P)-dependent dehydrogenase (short-subunit alcohol dehydrogenase family)